jgi:hypothetical protein
MSNVALAGVHPDLELIKIAWMRNLREVDVCTVSAVQDRLLTLMQFLNLLRASIRKAAACFATNCLRPSPCAVRIDMLPTTAHSASQHPNNTTPHLVSASPSSPMAATKAIPSRK